MDFRTEFFPLLNEILYKEESNISDSIVSNSDMFLFDRYTTFYNPCLVELINNTTNKFVKSLYFEDSGKYLYEVLKSILPKLHKSKISYISKKKSDLIKNADKFVKSYSQRHNISEREVWGMLFILEKVNKNF